MDATAAALDEAARLRQQKRDRIKARVRELHRAGLSRSEIMTRVRISSSYYYLLVNELKKENKNA